MYVEENARRNALLDEPYDPVAGVNSPVARQSVEFSIVTGGEKFVWGVPVSMLDEKPVAELLKTGCASLLLEKTGITPSNANLIKFANKLFYLRCEHDFEFWASQCVYITDKTNGGEILFLLNRPQRKLLKEFERQRLANRPIRVILLKARQWGGSTLTQIYMIWLQRFHRQNWNSVIVGDVEEQARNIRAMYSLAASRHPKNIATLTMKNHEGSSKNKVLDETHSVISIGSMQKPESLRSANISLCHLSEIGFWQATRTRKPADVIQTIAGTVANSPYTFIVKESTAKGVGNYFQQSWDAAVNGKSNDVPIFVAWFEIGIYRMPLFEPVDDFVRSLSEYEKCLWEMGATLEGINWYRHKFGDILYDEWRMQSEFPSTPQEAFQSTGARVFPPSYVQNMRKTIIDPVFVGEVFADAASGPASLNGVRLEATTGGNLHVWLMPEAKRWTDRYVVSVDTGGTTEKADWSVISVIDRYMLQFGGALERAAVWKGHIDHDRLAWKAVQLCKLYNNALLVVEKNYLDADVENEGDSSYTILNEIANHYSNLYHSTPVDKIRPGLPLNYGWHTNRSTKPQCIDTLKKLIRDSGYIEHYETACNEADCYEWKPDGSMGAVEGANDDVIMSTAIGVTVALDARFLGVPREVKESENNRFAVSNPHSVI